MAKTKRSGDDTSLPDEGHLAKLPARISPSRAKEYMQCPKLFYYKTILGISTPNTLATARGTLAHSAFEFIFEHPRPERTIENAVAYVRPAWRVLTDPTVKREDVEAGTPEDLLRTASKAYREFLPRGSKKEQRALAKAADYLSILTREAAERTEKLQASDPAAPAVTADEVEEELLLTAEQMVVNYFSMENPTKFDPDGRELHVQATTMGVSLHGFIDRLDKVVTPDGETRWYISDYKGLDTKCPLPTPSGWTTMGEVQAGDELLGADGNPTRVLVKSEVHHRPCYRVEFDDASSVVCDNVHLWQVEYGLRSQRASRWMKTMVVSADELHALVAEGKYPVTIPNARALQLPEADLPLDPYVLGYWLGDGDSRKGYLHVHDTDLEHAQSALSERGETLFDSTTSTRRKRGMNLLRATRQVEGLCRRGHEREKGKGCHSCVRTKHKGFPTHDTLSGRLRELGLLKNKHVPAEYLRASYDQRLSLLQGLMDTDGSWNRTRKQAVFTTTREELASGVEELVHSLGGRTSRAEKPYVTKKGKRSKGIQVMFTPDGYNPFTLPRKADLVRTEAPQKSKRRQVTAVVPVDSVPTQCVKVDAPDSLYLAGRQMVPTHNTGKVPGEGKKYAPHTMARIEEEAFFAMKIYALLFWEMHKVVPYQLRLVYVKTGTQEGIKTLNVTPAMLNSTRNQVSAVWKSIKSSARKEEWETKTGPLCPWCYFQPVCPAFNNGEDLVLPEEVALRGGLFETSLDALAAGEASLSVGAAALSAEEDEAEVVLPPGSAQDPAVEGDGGAADPASGALDAADGAPESLEEKPLGTPKLDTDPPPAG